jgi:hypothetical protein
MPTQIASGLRGSISLGRCAANDQIDDNAALVGAPAYMATTTSNYQYYFVTISTTTSFSRSSTSSIRSANLGQQPRLAGKETNFGIGSGFAGVK